MKQLNLRDMTKVYVLLKDVLPEQIDGILLEYVNEFVQNIIRTGQYKNFQEAMVIMTGVSSDTIEGLTGDDAMSVILDVVQVHNIPVFQEVIRRLYDRN